MYRFHQGGHWTETAVAFPALSSKCGALRVEDMWRPWDLQKSIAISTRRISRQRPEYVWGRPHGFRLPLSARGSVFHLKPASCTRRNSVSQSGDTLSNHKAIISQEKLSWTSLNFVCDFDCGQQRRHWEDGSAGHEKTNHTQLMGLQMWWFDFGKPNFWTGFICCWSNAIHVDTMIARKFPKHVVMGFCLGSDRWPPHTCNHIIWSTRGCHH